MRQPPEGGHPSVCTIYSMERRCQEAVNGTKSQKGGQASSARPP